MMIAAHEPPNILVWIRQHAFSLAITDIGRGEEPWPGKLVRNNDGPWLVEEVRLNDGTGLKTDTGGPWCASWVSYRLEISRRDACSYFDIEIRLPFRTSRSALTLCARMTPYCKIIRPEEAQEGDLFFMKRTGGGHTGWCRGPAVDGKLPTLDGNVGRVPALVHPLERDVDSILQILRLGAS